jgi:hypothetical protein
MVLHSKYTSDPHVIRFDKSTKWEWNKLDKEVEKTNIETQGI